MPLQRLLPRSIRRKLLLAVRRTGDALYRANVLCQNCYMI